jgi:hypothetical protein
MFGTVAITALAISCVEATLSPVTCTVDKLAPVVGVTVETKALTTG